MQKAAAFRGGKLLSTSMEKGNWRTKPEFECAFGHCFQASPRLVLKGGHWCDECERKSWNYGQRAKADPFLPRSGIPFTTRTSCGSTPKEVSELDVSFQWEVSPQNMYNFQFSGNLARATPKTPYQTAFFHLLSGILTPAAWPHQQSASRLVSDLPSSPCFRPIDRQRRSMLK